MTAPNEFAARTVLAALANSRVGAPAAGCDLDRWFTGAEWASVGLSSGEFELWRLARMAFYDRHFDVTQQAMLRLDAPSRRVVLSAFGEWIDVPADWLRLAAYNAELQAAIAAALGELGVPGPDYPAPVANAVALLRAALGDEREAADAGGVS